MGGGCGGGLFLSCSMAARCRGVPGESSSTASALADVEVSACLLQRTCFGAALLPDVLVLLVQPAGVS